MEENKLDIKDFPSLSSAPDTCHILLVQQTGSAGKLTIGLFKTMVKRDVLPSIKDGIWWVGEVDTKVEAIGKSPVFRKGATGIEWKYASAPDESWSVAASYDSIKLKYADLTEEQRAQIISLDNMTAAEIARLQQPANDMIVILRNTNESVTAAEALRVEKENTRVTEEGKRATEESERDTAERLRAQEETLRKQKEEARVTEESNRQFKESERIKEETVRNQKETSRQSSEGTRVAHENERDTAEGARVVTENARIEAEKARVGAENIRIAAEKSRAEEYVRVITQTNEAKNQAIQAAKDVDEATQKALAAADQADTARDQATAAADQAISAAGSVEQAKNQAVQAAGKADESAAKADEATVQTNTARDQAAAAALAAKEIAEHQPYIGEDYYFYQWNLATKAYDKTNIYTKGEGFSIFRSYTSVALMRADKSNVPEGRFVMINTGDVENPDNAQIYFRNSSAVDGFDFVVDMSGAIGFMGKTPQFFIGNVVSGVEGSQATVSLSSIDEDESANPMYAINMSIPRGDKGKAPSISIGTVNTVNPGTPASADIIPDGVMPDGTPKYKLNISIPQGMEGSLTAGDAKELTVTFPDYEERDNIASGDKLSVMFGKIKKWFSDIKTVAFTGKFSDLTDTPTTIGGYGITDGVLNTDNRLTNDRKPLAHTHPKADVRDFPDSLPANGGEADSSNVLNVKDIRDTSPIPSNKNKNSVTAWFDQRDTPSGHWWAGICVTGWETGYGSWEIAGPSEYDTIKQTDLFCRVGVRETWSPWRRILDSENWASVVDGRYLPLNGEKAMTGVLNMNGNQIILGNGGKMHTDPAGAFYLIAKSDMVAQLPANAHLYVSRAGVNSISWDAGNDGAGSGLDADLLDGVQSTSYFQSNRGYILIEDIDTFVNRPSGTYSVHTSGSQELLTVFSAGGGSAHALELFSPYPGGLKFRMNIDGNRYGNWQEVITANDCSVQPSPNTVVRRNGIGDTEMVEKRIIFTTPSVRDWFLKVAAGNMVLDSGDKSGKFLLNNKEVPVIGTHGIPIETTINTVSLDEDTYYPVRVRLVRGMIEVYTSLGASGNPYWSTHANGFSTYFREYVHAGAWGAFQERRLIEENQYLHINDYSQPPVKNIGGLRSLYEEVIWVRGGGIYYFNTTSSASPILVTEPYTINGETIGPVIKESVPLNALRNNIINEDTSIRGLANTIVRRDSAGNIEANSFRLALPDDPYDTIASICFIGTHGLDYIRRMPLAIFKERLGAQPASDVPDWAKQPDKPVYTAGDVGALGTDHNTSGAAHQDIRDLIVSYLANAKGYADTKIAALIGSAPEILDTLGELANAIVNNQSAVDAINAAIAQKLGKTEAQGLYVAIQGYVGFSQEEKIKLAGLSNYNDSELRDKLAYYENSNQVSTLAGLPINKRLITASLSSATNISLAAGMAAGSELIVSITPTAAFDQPIPTTGGWNSLDGDKISLTAGKITEISVLCVAASNYVVSSKTSE